MSEVEHSMLVSCHSRSQLQATRLYQGKRGDMRTFRQLQNFWILWVTTIVLACFSNAAAQASYKVTDLGSEGNDNLGCAMSLNNQGWTEIMAGDFTPGTQDFVPAYPLKGRALLGIDGFKLDLGTLGGENTWMNWGEINDVGQVVGYSETKVPDPNGEDVCGFGTHVKCLPFLWQFPRMRALPTLGGNNGQASAINDRGQIVGFAENGDVDSTCSPGTTNNRIRRPALWENGKARALPTGSDPDGVAFWINNRGQAVGDTGTCGGATSHAASWINDTLTTLQDLGTFAAAVGINDQGQIVGFVGSSDNTTFYGAIWENDTLTTLGPDKILPGDFGGIASGINSKGQVVGSDFDSQFNWSHAFIYQNGVMTDLNKLIPEDSNLYATMANKINERGQISGMARVLSGPHKGDIHAFLATPVNESIGRSVADVAPTRPQSNVPANASKQVLPRFVLGRFAR
jgi:probable HAF family extracellular repeat protein